jgi:hypothetical protein
MEDADYLALLRENDIPSFEDPPGFDYAKELEDVRNLQISLENHFGFRPSLDDQVQDSPHFAGMGLKRKSDPGPRAVIRFSKFGRMATIVCPEALDAKTIDFAIDELTKHRYVYIPSSVLASHYDGPIEGVETWNSRFFYYI